MEEERTVEELVVLVLSLYYLYHNPSNDAEAAGYE